MDTDSPIERAIKLAGGSEAKLGDALGCSQVAVNKARRKGRVSPEMAIKIDTFSNGAISKTEMRPDIWPAQSEQEQVAS